MKVTTVLTLTPGKRLETVLDKWETLWFWEKLWLFNDIDTDIVST